MQDRRDPVEQLHSLLHGVHSAPAHFVTPATVCARVRHDAVQTKLANSPEFLAFFRRAWTLKTFKLLLKPLLGEKALPDSFAQKYAYTYGYDLSSLHPDVAAEKKVHTKWDAMLRSKRSTREPPVSPAGQAALEEANRKEQAALLFGLMRGHPHGG